VVLVDPSDALRAEERLESAEALQQSENGEEETHLELEHLLEVGEREAGDEEEVVLDKVLGRLLGAHDDLEERVDVLHVPRNVARVPAEGTSISPRVESGAKGGRGGRTRSGSAPCRPERRRGGAGSA